MRALLSSLPLVAAVFAFPPVFAAAEESNLDPSIQFTVGLAGDQTRLTWVAQPGARYRIHSSTVSPASSAMQPRAVVEASSTTGTWTDPASNGVRGFYWIEPPEPEVFSVEPAVLTPSGDLVIRAQCLPAGSSIAFDLDAEGGLPATTITAPVMGSGSSQTAVLPSFDQGYLVARNARIVDSLGATICPIDQTFEVTSSGFASDGPPALPPAAPMNLKTKTKSNQSNERVMGSGGGAGKASISDLSFMSARVLKTKTKSNQSNERISSSQPQIVENQKGLLVSFSLHRPGEVSLQECDLSLATPAGPPLHCVRTYRSMNSISSGGSGWDFCYEARITSAGPGGGPHVRVFDGAGRSDLFVRRGDGSYVCDGHFKEGRFSSSTFTLTFADSGRWVFHPLDGSPTAGKLHQIIDRHGVTVTCAHDGSGRLSSVSSQFGQSLSITRDGSGRISTVTDHTGRFVSYSYYGAGSADGPEGMLSSVSCPTLPGQPPVQGATTYVYSVGSPVAALNGNMLSSRDGAGRLLFACAYSSTTIAGNTDFDRCVTLNLMPDVIVVQPEPLLHISYRSLPLSNGFAGGLSCYVNDELGRVTRCDFDRQYRCVREEEFTGFSIPGQPVTSSSNLPTGQLRASDPSSFVTTYAWNPDHQCTRCVCPDGLQEITTYDRSMRSNCPVRERGNARVMTLRSPGGEERTVSCEYQSGFGSCEASVSAKKSRSNISNNRTSGNNGFDGIPLRDPDRGQVDDPPFFRSNALPGFSCSQVVVRSVKPGRMAGGASTSRGDITYIGTCDADNGGSYVGPCDAGGVGGIFVAAGDLSGDGLAECTSRLTPNTRVQDFNSSRSNKTSSISFDGDFGGGGDGFVTSLRTAHGQTFSCTRNAFGDCVSTRTPISGSGTTCVYNALGQCTSVTVLNGAASSFVTQYNYDASSHFCSSVVRDPSGLALTTSCVRDSLGRVTSVTNPRGHVSSCSYNPCDQVVSVSSPPVSGQSITCSYFYDQGGLFSRCDVEHRDSSGALDAANPAYSSFFVYDNRCCLIRTAVEQKPVTVPPGTDPPADLSSFDVRDLTLDPAGQCVRISQPAASWGQSVDRRCDYQYDERGLLYRCVEGGVGTTGAVTTECDYTPGGMLSACRTVAPPGTESPTETCTYDGFRRPSSCTDPMGNVTSFSYNSQGHTTVEVRGETNDGPGGTGNQLLSRTTIIGDALIIFRDDGLNGDRIIESRDILKSYFQTGDVPTQEQFRNLIDSLIIFRDDGLNGDRVAGRAITTKGTGVVFRTARTQKKWLCSNFRPAFFDVFVDSPSIQAERFAPGAPAPRPTETYSVRYSPAGLPISVSNTGDVVRTFGHDTAGRCVSVTCPGASSVVCSLDACGNPVSCVVTAMPTQAGASNETFTTTCTFDELQRCVSSSDSMGSTRSRSFDSLSRCVSETSPNGFTMTCAYDVNGATGFSSRVASGDVNGDSVPDILSRDVCLGGVCSSSTDALGHSTSQACDAQGRCVQTNHPDGTFESVSFDVLGRPVTYRHPNGMEETRTFDLSGRCVSSSFGGAIVIGVTPVPPTTYTFDGLHRCVSVTQGTSVVSCSFDSCGNRLTHTQDGHTVTCSYNHRGRTGCVYPTGERFAETRDLHGRLLSFSSLTPGGAPISPPISSCDYLGFSCVREVRSNDVVTTCDIRSDNEPTQPGVTDFSFGQCVRTTVTTGTGTVLEDHFVRRNRDQFVTQDVRAFESGAQPRARRMSFTLDARNLVTTCLTQVRISTGGLFLPESEVSYTRDLRGQRTSATGGSNPGTYSQSSAIPPGDEQMGQYSSWRGGSPLHWTENGDLEMLSRSSGDITLHYDALRRLSEVRDSLGATIVSYAYNGLNQRISTTSFSSGAPVTTQFVYEGDTCIQELDAADGLPNQTFAVSGGIRLCISTRNGTLYYPHGGGGSMEAGRLRVWQLMQGQNANPAMRWTPLVPKPAPITFITDSLGAAVERFAHDDAHRPIFLNADGSVRLGETSALSGFRWFEPACLWCPETQLYQCDEGIYCPDLGQMVSSQRRVNDFYSGPEFPVVRVPVII